MLRAGAGSNKSRPTRQGAAAAAVGHSSKALRVNLAGRHRYGRQNVARENPMKAKALV